MAAKRFDELGTRELCDLTDEQITHYREVASMEAGVALPFEPEQLAVTDDPDVPQGDFFGVTYKGRYSTENSAFVFSDQQQALDFIALKPLFVDYDYAIGTAFSYATPIAEAGVTPRRLVASKDHLVAVRAVLEQNKSNREANIKARSEFESAAADYARASEFITDSLRLANGTKWAIERSRKTYNKYLGLTEQDQWLAVKFLRQSVSREAVADMVGWCDDLDMDNFTGHLDRCDEEAEAAKLEAESNAGAAIAD